MVATRGYFPRKFRAAVKQRSRWIMGIALQSWELNGWRETVSQLYWFWRDRKGVLGSLIGPLANLVFFYGVADWYVRGWNPVGCWITIATDMWQGNQRADLVRMVETLLAYGSAAVVLGLLAWRRFERRE